MKNEQLETLRGRMGLTTDNLQKQEAQNALNQLAQQQALQNQITGYAEQQPGFEKGKSGIPKMGVLSNIIPNAIGGLASAYQYFDAANQDIRVPNVYAENPYASVALNNLAGIRINPYESMREMYNAERRNKYALSRTGGLTGGQKFAAQVASGIGTQNNIGRMLNDIQAQNNAYKTAYNQALLQSGEQQAQRLQNANQIREEMTARSHAAKQQQMQMGMRNFMDYLNNYAANEYRRKTGNAMLDLYQEDIDLQKANIDYLRSLATRGNNTEWRMNYNPDVYRQSGDYKFIPSDVLLSYRTPLFGQRKQFLNRQLPKLR